MSNTLLTPLMITREALRILHQKLNFIAKCNRQYDNRFAQAGAKIGTTLNIRKPPRYTVSTGAALSTQDTTETQVALTVATQKHVDTTFSSVELTMQLDDFSKTILEPGMAQLAAAIEADALSMYQQVWNQVGSTGSPLNSLGTILNARKRLNDNLAPMDGARSIIMNTDANVQIVSSLQGLFQSSERIAEQYEEGMMGQSAGFKWYENTLIPYQTGATYGSSSPTWTSTVAGGASIVTGGWAVSTIVLKPGDVFTIAGVFPVHPETRQAYGYLQQFVATAQVTSDSSGNATIPIAPSIITTGAFQTVSNVPGPSAVITPAATSGQTYGVNLAFHKDAFAFATADLEDVSKYGAWGARDEFEGISMRIARQYAIGTDTVPCRIDVLYGYVPLYPQLACRIANAPQTS